MPCAMNQHKVDIKNDICINPIVTLFPHIITSKKFAVVSTC